MRRHGWVSKQNVHRDPVIPGVLEFYKLQPVKVYGDYNISLMGQHVTVCLMGRLFPRELYLKLKQLNTISQGCGLSAERQGMLPSVCLSVCHLKHEKHKVQG